MAEELQSSATDDVSSWSASSMISYFIVAYMMTDISISGLDDRIAISGCQ